MQEIGIALLIGVTVGVVFQLFKQPLPAPPVLSGVVGIFGIYLGGQIVKGLGLWFGG